MATRARSGRRKGAGTAPVKVTVWQDDPGEPGSPGSLTTVTAPESLRDAPFAIAIAGRAARPDDELGSTGMRYWTAATALARSRRMWLRAIGADPPAWADARRLAVVLDDGAEVNAYYDRGQLSFHVAEVVDIRTQQLEQVATGESPDIVAHELGHAVLDAIRPELWDANFAEVAAFHEAFGDISAVLTALELPAIQAELAALPSSSLFVSTRVSRLGERMGWGLRQTRTDLPDPNCLRDAVNTFFYVKPETLPTTAPSSGLSSEPHNFSRVFAAAFMRVLDEMLKALDRPRTAAKVRQVGRDAAAMLVDAVIDAPVVGDYYHAVAMEMVAQAGRKRGGIYRKAVVTAFVRTGIITVPEAREGSSGAAAPPAAPAGRSRRGRRGAVGAGEGAPATRQMNLAQFGVDETLALDLGEVRTVARRRGVVANTADEAGGDVTAINAAEYFVHDLFRRNRVNLAGDVPASDVPLQPPRTVTHRFERTDGGLRIKRLRVDCGFDIT